METPEGMTAELWTKLAEQGWLGLIYPEAVRRHAGSAWSTWSCSWRRWAAPSCRARTSPPCSSAALAILEAGSDAQKKEWLPRIAAGRQARRARLDGAERARSGRAGVDADRRAEKDGRYTLSGHQALRARRAHRGRASWWPRARGRGQSPRTASRCSSCRRARRASRSRCCPPWTRRASSARSRCTDVARRRRRAARRGGRGLDAARPRARPRHRGALRRDVRRRPEGARHDGRVREDPRRPSAARSAPTRASSTAPPTCWSTSRTASRSPTTRRGRSTRTRRKAPLAASMAKAYVSDAYRRVAGGGHPAPRRHRLHLGARPAPLLQAREGLGVHVRRRHVSSRAGGPAGEPLASRSRMIKRVRQHVRLVDAARSARARRADALLFADHERDPGHRAPDAPHQGGAGPLGARAAELGPRSRPAPRARRPAAARRNEDLRALGETVGGLAHNFNNSLAAILAYTELMLRERIGAPRAGGSW